MNEYATRAEQLICAPIEYTGSWPMMERQLTEPGKEMFLGYIAGVTQYADKDSTAYDHHVIFQYNDKTTTYRVTPDMAMFFADLLKGSMYQLVIADSTIDKYWVTRTKTGYSFDLP